MEIQLKSDFDKAVGGYLRGDGEDEKGA